MIIALAMLPSMRMLGFCQVTTAFSACRAIHHLTLCNDDHAIPPKSYAPRYGENRIQIFASNTLDRGYEAPKKRKYHVYKEIVPS